MDNRLSQWKLLGLPFALSFLLICVYGFSSVYSDALFLSTYSRSWLTYSYIALPLILIFVFFVVSPFLAKASNKQSFIFILSMVAILFVFYKFAFSGIYVMPFILTLLLAIFGKLISIMGLNAIAAAFDMQVFKQHVFKFNLLGTIGAIVTAFLTPMIIYFFHSSGIFYVTLITMILSALCILKIQQLPAVPSRIVDDVNISLNKQPFFIYLFIVVIMASIIEKLSGFAYKATLIGQFSQDGLAIFISVYSGIISVLCLLIQLFGAGPLLLRIGLMGMLLILPYFCFVMSFGIVIWPIFPIFVLMRAVYSTGEISFKDPCLEMIINPFPSALRKKVSFALKGYGSAISGLIGALLITVVNKYLPLNFIGILIAVFSLIWIYYTLKAGSGYQETLFKALKENRYNPDLFSLTPESVMFMHDDILKALNSRNLNILRAGLNFFDNETFIKFLPDKGLHQALIQNLSHPEKDIRYKAVIALKKLNEISASDAMILQLAQESEQAIGFAIMDALLHFGVLLTASQIEIYLQSMQSFKRAYAMITLDRSKESSQLDRVNQEIYNLMQGSVQDRLTVAFAQAYMSPSPSQTQCLKELLYDESDEVSIQAIDALPTDKSSQFVYVLIKMLNNKKKSYPAERLLSKFQSHILDTLLQIKLETPLRQRQAMIRLLARLDAPLALDKLIDLSQSSDVALRLFIANQVLRFSRLDISNTEIKQKIVKMLGRCADEIHVLLCLDAALDPGVLLEINLQLHLNRCVFVTWFSVLTDKYRVATVAHYIERPDDYQSIECAKAYELLDNLSIDTKLRQSVNLIAQSYLRNKSIDESAKINPGIVMLAHHPFTYQKGSPMNNMDKSALLRRVKLFEDIPVQSLLVIAGVTQERDMLAGEFIFKDNDEASQFYCVASGQVLIKKGDIVLSELCEADYFGELGLLDNMPRTADAVAKTDGALLYIEKQDFINVLEDLPEIMRAVMGQIIKYLRQNLDREAQKRL